MNEHELFDDELATRLRGLAPDVPADTAFAAMLPRFEQAKRRRRAGIASAAVAGLGSVAVVALMLGGGPSFTQDVRTNPASGGRSTDGSSAGRSTSTTDGNHDNGGIPGVDNSSGSGKGSGKSGSGNSGSGSNSSGSGSGSSGSGSSSSGSGGNSGGGSGGGTGSGNGGGSGGTTGTTTSTTTATTTPQPVPHTYNASGGSLTVNVTGTTITVVSVSSNPGYSAPQRNNHGDPNDVDYTFQPAKGPNSSIRVRFSNGQLQATVDNHPA